MPRDYTDRSNIERRDERKTPDQIALEILLGSGTPAQKQAALQGLAKHVRHAMGAECPECGSTSIEWNGHDGSSAGYRCADCDHRFGPDNEI